jgi:hypothetical protein
MLIYSNFCIHGTLLWRILIGRSESIGGTIHDPTGIVPQEQIVLGQTNSMSDGRQVARRCPHYAPFIPYPLWVYSPPLFLLARNCVKTAMFKNKKGGAYYLDSM